MGRKSAAKSRANTASSTSGAPPSGRGGSSTPLIAAGIVLVLAIVGLVAYTRSSQTPPAAVVAQAAPVIPDVPATASPGPHPQPTLPLLPFKAYSPPGPTETVRAVYRFAAEPP